MKIRGFLLASAAAVAAGGAQAADAIVAAEPEPVEYVRVCDVYGAGFLYVPGTETCLKISGSVQYDIAVGDIYGLRGVTDKWDLARGIADTNDTYYQQARATLDVDARRQTEFGTLRGFIELRMNYDMDDVDGDGLTDTNYNWDLNHAYIELGGLRIGKTDSLFSTWTGYGAAVINDTLIDRFGPLGTHQISYTFTSGAFSAAVALENGEDGDNTETFTIDSYMPNVVAGLAYEAGNFKLSGVAGYDSVWEDWSLKARLDIKASDRISGFLMAGWQSDSDRPNVYGQWGGDWAVWGGLAAGLTEKATLNAQLTYDDADIFTAAVNVGYVVTPGFTVTPEIDYINIQDGDDAWSGYVRFLYEFGG